MPDPKPVVYFLRGDDEVAVKDFLDKLLKHLGDASIAEMNYTVLDGHALDLKELRSATGAMPFLAERRIVVLSNFTSGAFDREPFCQFLDHLPETTALVLVLADQVKGKEKGWQKFPDSHWLIQWAQGAGKRALIKDVSLPDPRKMAGWVMKKVSAERGEFTPQAAAALAEHLGNDTRTAVLEIQKLLAYANYSRPVTREDVELLSARIDDPDIFALTDALGEKDARRALEELHVLLEDRDWPSILQMIVRQFRLLLVCREIIDQGGGVERAAQELGSKAFNVQPFLKAKLYRQAGRFSLPALEDIYRRLLSLEESLKSTTIDASVALDALVAELTR